MSDPNRSEAELLMERKERKEEKEKKGKRRREQKRKSRKNKEEERNKRESFIYLSLKDPSKFGTVRYHTSVY